MASDIQISLAPDILTYIGPVPITNAAMGTFVSSLLLILIALLIRRKAGIVPSRAQVALEVLIEFIMDKLEMSFGSQERARKFFPLIFTTFLFLIIANQFSMLPLIQSVVLGGEAEVFRTPTSHYALPITLALIMLFLAQLLAFTKAPIRHIGNFIKLDSLWKIRRLKDIPMAFMEFFLGLMDIVGEFAKMVSMPTRLFGNILAGEIIFVIITGLTFATQFVAPIPFLVLSTLSGFVQAFVFVMLAMIYISSSLGSVEKKTA